MIEVRDLSKSYGSKVAVNGLTFTVSPGKVTGFLGPNGAGKTTTMRLLLGLAEPDNGAATIDGVRYRDLSMPLQTVGALLEAKAVHGGRSAGNHLRCLAETQGLPRRRVDEVIGLVGLEGVAGKRAAGFSLGMAQRLGIAAALLGDPHLLVLDEPVNGLDPEGIVWIRNLMKRLAAEGRTVFVSSHLMNEMAVTADHLIVIGRGGLLANCSTAEFVDRHAESEVLMKTPDAAYLSDLIAADDGSVRPAGADTLIVAGVPASRIAELAAWARIVVYELTPQRASLEEAFMQMTRDSVEYGDSTATGNTAGGDMAGGDATGPAAGRPFDEDRIGSPS
jgi:ABC-2 type transport system ATP-binding protein